MALRAAGLVSASWRTDPRNEGHARNLSAVSIQLTALVKRLSVRGRDYYGFPPCVKKIFKILMENASVMHHGYIKPEAYEKEFPNRCYQALS